MNTHTQPFGLPPTAPNPGTVDPTQPLPVRGELVPVESTEWHRRMENIAGTNMPEDVRSALEGLHQSCVKAYDRMQKSTVPGESVYKFVNGFKADPDGERGSKLVSIKVHQGKAKNGQAEDLRTADYSTFDFFYTRDEEATSAMDGAIAQTLLQKKQVVPLPAPAPRNNPDRNSEAEPTPYDKAFGAAKNLARRIRTQEENDRVVKTAENYTQARRAYLGELQDDQKLAAKADVLGRQCVDELLLREIIKVHDQLVDANKHKTEHELRHPTPRGLGRLALGRGGAGAPLPKDHYGVLRQAIERARSDIDAMGKDRGTGQADDGEIAGFMESDAGVELMNEVIKKKHKIDILDMRRSNEATAANVLQAIEGYLTSPNGKFNQLHLPAAIMRTGELEGIVEQYIHDLSPKKRQETTKTDDDPHEDERKAIEDAAAAATRAASRRSAGSSRTSPPLREERTLGTKEAWQQDVDDAIEGLLAQSQVSEQAASAALQDIHRRFVFDETAPTPNDPNGMPTELRRKQSDYTKARVMAAADQVRQNISNL